MPPLKPGRWSVSPASVAPEWRGLWRGLVTLVPFWDDAGTEVIDNDLGSITGGRVLGAGGYGFDANGSNIKLVDNRNIRLDRGTFLMYFDGDGGPASFGKFFASDPDSQVQMYRDNSDTAVNLTVSGEGQSFTVPDLWGTGPHVIVGTYHDIPDRRAVWVDGVMAGESAVTFAPDTVWTNPTLGIGNRNTDTARDIGATIFLAAIWDRALTDEEIIRVSADPYGLLRRESTEVLPFTQPVLVLEDDFTGTNGDPLDSTKWKMDTNSPSTVEIQNNTAELQTSGSTRARIWSPEIDPQNYLDAYFQAQLESNTSDCHIGFMTEGRWDRIGGGSEGPIPDDAVYLKLEHGIHQGSSSTTVPVYGGTTGGDEAEGQAVTAGGTLDVYGIAIGLEKVGSPTDNISVRVRETSMTGTILGTSDAKAASGVVAGFNVFAFTGGEAFQMTGATTYYLEIYRSGSRDTSNYISVQNQLTGNPYSGGARWTKDEDSWAEQTTQDLKFSVGLPNLRREYRSGGAVLGPFGICPAATNYWYRLRYDGTYLWAKMWTGARTDEPNFWYSQQAYTGQSEATHWRFFASANPGGYVRIDNVEVRRATIVRPNISGITKPGRWAVTPNMVAPEWRGFWRELEIAVPLWDGVGNGPQEISAAGGVMAPAASATEPPTWTPTEYGWMAEFANTGKGGWTTNQISPGFPEGFPWTWLGLSRAGDLTGDQESVVSLATESYIRFDTGGSLSGDVGGAIPTVDTGASEINADDFVLWYMRNRTAGGEGTVELGGYNLTTGKYLTPDSEAMTADVGAKDVPIQIGHRGANDYGSRTLVFYSLRRYVTDAEFSHLIRDPFGPLRMDVGGSPVDIESEPPRIKDHTFGSKDTASNTLNVDWSSTTAAVGDLIIVHAVGDQNLKVDEAGGGVPTGWQKVCNESAAAAYNYGVWWKIATAADISTGNATWTYETGSQDFGYSVDVIEGGTFNPIQPFDVTNFGDEAPAVDGIHAIGVTTNGPNRLILTLAGSDGDAAGETFSSDLGSELYDDNDLTGDLMHVAGYAGTAGVAGTYTATITLSVTNELNVVVLAITPARYAKQNIEHPASGLIAPGRIATNRGMVRPEWRWAWR